MEILKKHRIKNKLSYQSMGNLLGISKTFYWQIENNKRRLSYERAIQISKIFTMEPDELFYEDIKRQEK